MQNTSRQLIDVLSGSVRDFVPVDLIEFYSPEETALVPGNAVKRFANTKLVWYGWEYEQQAISRGSTNRYIDERFNTVSLTFSNIDRRVGTWLSETIIAGYRVVIRAVSRSIDSDSIVLFVGRCEKPFSVNNSTVSLTIKQDLGSINSELPARKFTHACPLKFKGVDCLGGQTTLQKTPAYNDAATCDKSWQQCISYGNTDFFQGFRSTNVTGSFVLREASSFGIPTKSTKQWSSQDQTPINQHVPMGLGRTQIELTSIASADTGQFLYGHWVVGEGPITKFLNTRNVTPGFARRFEGQNSDGTPTGGGSYREHLGEYGNDDTQRSNSDFLGRVSYSGRAYVEGTIRGQNPDTGDPAPSIVSTVMWNKVPSAGDFTQYTTLRWSDNPVDHVRYLLTHERALQYPEEFVNDEVAIETARYCDEPLFDNTGGEDLVVAQNSDTISDSFLNGRFRSTGLIDPLYWRGRDGTYPSAAERRPQITYFPTENIIYDEFGNIVERQTIPPPNNLVPNQFFRKRYTANWHLKKGVKVSDFLFRQLLPSFKGYLVTGADGRLQIRSERAAVQARSSGAVTTAMNTIDVLDGVQFKNLNLPVKWILVRNPESTVIRFTVRRVIDVNYLTAANNITIAAPSSGAETMNCQIFGAAPIASTSTTFTGGSETAQAFAYILVTAGLTQNQTAGVRIDGVDVGAGGPIGDNIDAWGPNSWSEEIAAMIATNLNANPNLKNVNGVALRDYIEAVWEPSNPLMVLFRSKQATLILDSPFGIEHPAGDLVTHFHLPFSDGSDGRTPNIIKDSFEWPLGNRQSAYNQFSLTYQDAVQDSQSVAIVENDYDHQEATNQINKLEVPGGDCVDNYHQADRLLLAARYKYRESDFFVQFQTAGLGMLLEEGDLILVNHSSMPLYRNYLYRIEELSVSQDHRVSITARLYSDLQYPEQAVAKTVTLNRSNAWPTATLTAVQNVSITRVANAGNTARIAFEFPETVGQPRVRVLTRRRDPVTSEFIDADFIDSGIVLTPDENNQGIVEIPGLVTGAQVQLVPFTSTDVQGASISVSVPNLPTDAEGDSFTSIYQPLDADLTAIAALSADGLLRKSSGTWAMDSASYLTANQTITLSGDVTGSGTTAITTTIANNAVTTAKILDANVTLAKMANLTADRMIGRSGTTGVPQELTLSQALDFVGSAAQGDLLYRDASTWTRLGAGTRGRYLQTAGASANPSWASAMAFKNVIINGDMQVAQRATSFTSTGSANNDDAYTLDRWYLLTDGQDTIDVTQSTDAPSATTGAFTKRINSIALDVETINRKFGIAQIVERRNCEHLIGGVVSLSFKARVSSTTKLDKIRAAVVAWSGSADSVTSDIISAWNAEDSNPTLIANATFENTPTTLNTSTSWTSYTISNIAIDTANTTNLIVFIWSDVTDTTLGDFLYITDVQLEPGPVVTEFEYLPIDVQFARCVRYFLLLGSGNGRIIVPAFAYLAGGYFGAIYRMQIPMRSAPSLIQTTGTNYYGVLLPGGARLINDVLLDAGSASTTGVLLYQIIVAATDGDAGYLYNNNALSSLALNAEI